MKLTKTTMRKMVREIVREEVAMAIQEVITELKQPTQQVSKPKQKRKIIEKQNFSTNPIINEVMNETAANSEEWKTMGGETYTSDKMGDVLESSYGKMMNDDSDNVNGTLAASMGVNPNDPSADFLKKDYRKLMKAVDKKQGK